MSEPSGFTLLQKCGGKIERSTSTGILVSFAAVTTGFEVACNRYCQSLLYQAAWDTSGIHNNVNMFRDRISFIIFIRYMSKKDELQ